MSEEQILVRDFPVEFAQVGDGRTVDVRVVPYNTPTEVSDFGGPPYVESWVPGVFDHQTRAANRVWLNFEHEKGLRGVVGHGVELESRGDGFYGSFRVLDGPDGDKALQMVNRGLLPGVSLEAIPHRSTRTREGIVERLKATLKAVSLCREPAFREAQVLAVREAAAGDETEPDEAAPEPPPDGEPEPEAKRVSPQQVRDEMAAEELAKNPPEFSDAELALQRVGYEPLIKRAVVDKPWDGSPARFTDEQYERSALVCRPGDEPPKTRCSLPVLEPDGSVNRRALGAAAGRLNQTSLSPELKAQAARKLMRLYRAANMEPPANVTQLASR